ncbi:MAG: hypothetical protein GX879_02750, partial [Bacteroidales bacterium]|nr:hypothetical protein [Bacteroidales bacterium]
MILYYFIIAVVLALVALIVRQRKLAKYAAVSFAAVQASFAIYAFFNLDKTELSYFTYDALGVIFLLVLSIIFPAAVYHGFRYFKDRITNRFYYYHA